MWRKNRRPVISGCNGVDLNRNFAYHWNPGKIELSQICVFLVYRTCTTTLKIYIEHSPEIDIDYRFHLAH